MAALDNLNTTILEAETDYFVRERRFKNYGAFTAVDGFGDKKIISKGDLVEVANIDLDLYRLLGFGKSLEHEFLIRKLGAKKSYKVGTLFFLKGADKFGIEND